NTRKWGSWSLPRTCVPLLQIRYQIRIILRASGDLDHRNPHLSGKEVLRVGTLVRVATPAAVVLDHQVHLLDAFLPHDVLVLPPGGHGYVLLVDPFLAIEDRAGAAVAVALAVIWNVAESPCGWLTALGLFNDFGADVDRPISIVHGRCPVARAI